MGLSSSYSSQTLFSMAAKGKNKIIPATPQAAAPTNKLQIAVKAFMFILLPTIFGLRKLAEIN